MLALSPHGIICLWPWLLHAMCSLQLLPYGLPWWLYASVILAKIQLINLSCQLQIFDGAVSDECKAVACCFGNEQGAVHALALNSAQLHCIFHLQAGAAFQWRSYLFVPAAATHFLLPGVWW